MDDNGLRERHRLDSEHSVPADLQLVDHHVGGRVAQARFAVRDAFDQVELDRRAAGAEGLDRREHGVGSLDSSLAGGVSHS